MCQSNQLNQLIYYYCIRHTSRPQKYSYLINIQYCTHAFLAISVKGMRDQHRQRSSPLFGGEEFI